jgi:hypothetical protein
MKISELPYYVKFVFLCSDGNCYSTSDIRMLEHIKSVESGEPVSFLGVGDRIIFVPKTDDIYRIASVAIQYIVDDTELMHLGVDLEDCTEMQGEKKNWLLKILLRADRE